MCVLTFLQLPGCLISMSLPSRRTEGLTSGEPAVACDAQRLACPDRPTCTGVLCAAL